jgi:cell division protein YceG involved in septum cleavage
MAAGSGSFCRVLSAWRSQPSQKYISPLFNYLTFFLSQPIASGCYALAGENSMKKELRDLINGTNATKSTGPKTPEGKQRASMNAFKHGLTGNRILLQTHEHEAYRQLTNALNKDLQPKSELERQLV